ncbi:M57 family metalloprotease [Aquimarina sp. RZ0]|uniref:M57 family metalloprotease n=1 Tax=Aquimarina sp. RZ0 TaxID=2607730 RepID=UPI0011F1402A|nr:M57 family metalloprotease [Aquimarina sp. RZ0]KAA1246481.1 hypothetical protein F0000_07690 [Aquimarina sp. RZ0]
MRKLLSVLILLVIVSCSVDQDIETIEEQLLQTNPEKALSILEELGFNTFNATMDEEFITIEGDIMMNIAFILESYEKEKGVSQAKQSLSRKHTFYGGRVSSEYNNRVKFSMAPNMRAEWLPALQIAISRYNKVNECRVQMSYTTGRAHSHISFRDLGSNTLGRAEFPKKTVHSNLKTYRKPGEYIYIHPTLNSNASLEDKVHLLMHEMGHNMGFEHVFDNAAHRANYSFDGTQIAGTILYEKNSVMNADGYDSRGIFTPNDKIALKTIYPGPFVSDFNQTITGPTLAATKESVTYRTSVTNPGNTYRWEVKYVGAHPWTRLHSNSASVTFRISTRATPNGLNNMNVRCTIVKPNGDEGRKVFSTLVEGRPTDGTHINL